MVLVVRVFANGLVDRSSNLRSRHSKDTKMLLDTALLNRRNYNVRIKGKVELTMERSSALLYTSV